MRPLRPKITAHPQLGSSDWVQDPPRGVLWYTLPLMRFNVYVDGFNLYYGALRGTPYRWLDLCAFARKLLRPGDELNRLRYFSALVMRRSKLATARRLLLGFRDVPSLLRFRMGRATPTGTLKRARTSRIGPVRSESLEMTNAAS